MATTTFFSTAGGRVSYFEDPTLSGSVAFRMDNWDGFVTFKSIITRIAISSACNYQVLHSLGGDSFIYVFGDRIGQVIISGLAFESTCDSPKGELGLDFVRKYYHQNRLSARETPIKLTLGTSLTLKLYLGGLNTDVEDVGSKIWRFAMTMLEVPEPLPKLTSSGGSTSGGDPLDTEPGSPGDIGKFDSGDLPDPDFDIGGFDGSGGGVIGTGVDGYEDSAVGPSISVGGFALA